MRIENVVLGFYSGVSEDIKEIIVRYWTINGRGGFEESVAAICKDIGDSPEGLLALVRKHSRAFLSDSRCPECGGQFYVDCRRAFLERMRVRLYQCDSCPGSIEEAEPAESDVRPDNVQQALDAIESSGVPAMRIYAEHMISLEDFNLNPEFAVEGCDGAALVVVKDGAPFFYCASPDAMASHAVPGSKHKDVRSK